MRTSDRRACQALGPETMTSGCPQSQVLLMMIAVLLFRVLAVNVVVLLAMIVRVGTMNLLFFRLGNDLVWWLHQQCAPRGRRQGGVKSFKQFLNNSNITAPLVVAKGRMHNTTIIIIIIIKIIVIIITILVTGDLEL